MKSPIRASRIIWYEIAAFLSIIAFTWAHELSGLEGMLFESESGPPNWRGATIATAFTVLIGIPAVLMSWRLARRLHYLEGFVRVCAWCHKVGEGDEWITIETFVRKTLNTETTHGICPTCLKKFQRERDSLG